MKPLPVVGNHQKKGKLKPAGLAYPQAAVSSSFLFFAVLGQHALPFQGAARAHIPGRVVCPQTVASFPIFASARWGQCTLPKILLPSFFPELWKQRALPSNHTANAQRFASQAELLTP